MDYFHGEFGSRTLHCPIVSAPAESPEFIPLDQCLRLQGDGIAYSISNLAQGVPNALSLAVRLLRSLINETPIRNYCPAGKTEVTVNADGNVYACFMLMQRETFSFGNVCGNQIIPKEKPSLRIVGQSQVGSEKEVIERFIADADKYSSNTCRQCWAQPLCYGCLGEDFERHGGRVFRSEVPGVSIFCDYRRGVVERFLGSIALAYSISGTSQPKRSPSIVEALAQ
jgi:radical SAM protein with 4Fe4S-binding SPASM domain